MHVLTLNSSGQSKRRKLAFSNLIRTDGFTADVVINKSVKTSTEDYAHYSHQDVDISLLGDILKNENLDTFSLCGVDPTETKYLLQHMVTVMVHISLEGAQL
jgi:hypothetical protein